MNEAPVGFVGLGVMGSRLAVRLCAAGHRVLAHTRTADHLGPVLEAGGEAAGSLGELGERCDVVLSCLLDTCAVHDVYTGKAGLLAAVREGQVFAEHGTFSPELARRLAHQAADGGATFLDVPITGGPEGAEQGTLVAMAGGDADALARITPLLRAYAREVVAVGPSGSGVALKLVNQLLVIDHVAASAEAAAALRRLGLPWERALAVLSGGWAASAMLARCLPPALGGPAAAAGARLDGLRALRGEIDRLTRELGVAAPVFAASADLLGLASERGLGARDVAALVEVFEIDERSVT